MYGRIDHGEFNENDIDNVQQPEIADETGNSYTITARIGIRMANPGVMTMASLNKVWTSDCDSDRRPEIAILLAV